MSTEPQATATESCGNCHCFLPPKAGAAEQMPRGLCRRYPATIAKLPREWCLEWVPKET